MIVKQFGCTTIHNKSLNKFIICSFIHSFDPIKKDKCLKKRTILNTARTLETPVMHMNKYFETLNGFFFFYPISTQFDNYTLYFLVGTRIISILENPSWAKAHVQ